MATIRKRILLVDDDDALRSALADQLELQEEFSTVEAREATEAMALLEEGPFDAVLLDVGLPDMDGRDVCRRMRRRGDHTPVVLLTGIDSEADTILGLDSGANDYVTKPVRLGVLLARLRAHMRQHELSEDATLPLGPYSFRPAARILHHNGSEREVPLSDKECAILRFLYRAGNTPVSCGTLYAEVWDYRTTLMTHTLQTHIYRLRRKIEEDPSHPAILVSEQGGYRLAR